MQNKYFKTAQHVLRHLTEESAGGNGHFSMEKWEWPQGVALYAMYKVWRKTGDAGTLAYMLDWYARQMAAVAPEKNVNTCAPMLGMACLYEQLGTPAFLEPIREWAHWVLHDMARTKQNGLQHITSGADNDQQLWDDTLYMTVLFLYKAGQILKNRDMKNLACYQFLLHIRFLQDTHTGLWYHGWTFDGNHNFGRVFWARGNAWLTACGPDFLEMLDEEDAAYTAVLHSYQSQAAALCRLQDEKTGLWHTILDDGSEASYLETSATAGIAYGLLKGVRQGLLPQTMQANADKAASGVLSMIDERGLVQGTSYGTCVGDDADYYKAIPVTATAYGQGLTFLMLTEMM